MLKGKLVHPEILSALGSAGHGSKVLIADGNYPHVTKLGPKAKLVFANFSAGILDAVTVLKLLAGVIPIEAAQVMRPQRTGPYAMKQDPPIWAEFRKLLREQAGFEADLEQLEKPEFYEAGSDRDVCLTIATGEGAIYANLLLTIGVLQ